MTNKLEEATKAYVNRPENDEWDELSQIHQDCEKQNMRAAIAVLREPSKAMVKAGKWYDGNPKGCWQAMIDEMEGE